MKIFIIGFNKTGTTTLHEYFLDIGFKSHHKVRWKSKLEDFDVFSDGNFESISDFKYYDQQFKDSKFILNTRDFKGWCTSRLCHGYRNAIRDSNRELKRKNIIYKFLLKKLSLNNLFLKSQRNWAYPATHELIVAWSYRKFYHHNAVLDYFLKDSSRINKLICVDITKEGWLQFISEKLNLKKPNSNFHKNLTKNTNRIEEYKILIEKYLEEGLKYLSITNPEMVKNLLNNSIGIERKRFNELTKNKNFFV